MNSYFNPDTEEDSQPSQLHPTLIYHTFLPRKLSSVIVSLVPPLHPIMYIPFSTQGEHLHENLIIFLSCSETNGFSSHPKLKFPTQSTKVKYIIVPNYYDHITWNLSLILSSRHFNYIFASENIKLIISVSLYSLFPLLGTLNSQRSLLGCFPPTLPPSNQISTEMPPSIRSCPQGPI